ncbi:hypothetical protein Slin14017_G082790 [Septoria linicola]|nr:hypothetical protein Slin14017_G082790 [Septoria linicola]
MLFITKIILTGAAIMATLAPSASAWQLTVYQNGDCSVGDGVNYMTYRGSGNDCHIMGKSDNSAKCYYLLDGGKAQGDCSTTAWKNDFVIPHRGGITVPPGTMCTVFYQTSEANSCVPASNSYDFDGGKEGICKSHQFMLDPEIPILAFRCQDV